MSENEQSDDGIKITFATTGDRSAEVRHPKGNALRQFAGKQWPGYNPLRMATFPNNTWFAVVDGDVATANRCAQEFVDWMRKTEQKKPESPYSVTFGHYGRVAADTAEGLAECINNTAEIPWTAKVGHDGAVVIEGAKGAEQLPPWEVKRVPGVYAEVSFSQKAIPMDAKQEKHIKSLCDDLRRFERGLFAAHHLATLRESIRRGDGLDYPPKPESWTEFELDNQVRLQHPEAWNAAQQELAMAGSDYSARKAEVEAKAKREPTERRTLMTGTVEVKRG